MLLLLLGCLLPVLAFSSPCCTPGTWEGDVGIVMGTLDNGTTMSIEGRMRMSYDGVNRRLAIKQNITVAGSGVNLQQTIIQNFETGQHVLILSDGTCTKYENAIWTPNCIPDNATDGGKLVYGLDSDSVEATYYFTDYGNYQVYMLVTSDTCVPVAEDVVGTGLGFDYLMETLTFSNIKVGIQDTAVFAIPSSCNDALALTAPAKRYTRYA